MLRSSTVSLISNTELIPSGESMNTNEGLHVDWIGPKMLRVPQGMIPEPAAEVIRQLATQTRALRAHNTHKHVDCVRGTFHSPMASWLPPKSQHCEFFVLKPPAGALALRVATPCPS